MATWLVVGLGNPGPKYAGTRHNLGFEVVDELSRRWNAPFSAWGKSLLAKAPQAILLKPMTFMNLSGEAVQDAEHFFKCGADHTLVVSDDLDLPPGVLRLRPTGGAGGHNGMKSIIQHLGGEGFPRVRIGIGRDPHGGPSDRHVLAKIGKSEIPLYTEAVKLSADAVEAVLTVGMDKAMNVYNVTKKEVTP